MTQINEVTHSLQDTATSNYRDENVSFGGIRKEPVKAKETAVDLLQSFAISTPSTVKKAPVKSSKPTKLESSVVPAREDASVPVKDMIKEMPLKDVDHDGDIDHDGGIDHHDGDADQQVDHRDGDDHDADDVHNDNKQATELKPPGPPLKQHYKLILSSSSSEESEGDNDTVLLPVVTADVDIRTDIYNDNSFTTRLHNELYPCSNEQPEVKWSPRTPSTATTVAYINKHKQYSCFIHPAAPWHRSRALCKRSITKVTKVSCSSPVLKDKPQEAACSGDRATDEATVKQSGRLRKRKTREAEHFSSDSDTEPPLKIIDTDNSAANEQVIINPTGTRTSKRVRRAPIKLRQ